MRIGVRILRMRPDVRLDQGRQGRHLAGMSTGMRQTGFRRTHRQPQRAVAGSPTTSGDVKLIDDCAHTGSPVPHPS